MSMGKYFTCDRPLIPVLGNCNHLPITFHTGTHLMANSSKNGSNNAIKADIVKSAAHSGPNPAFDQHSPISTFQPPFCVA